jgi:hypothetical protein
LKRFSASMPPAGSWPIEDRDRVKMSLEALLYCSVKSEAKLLKAPTRHSLPKW